MTDNEKQRVLDRLHELETMLYQMNEIVLDLSDRTVKSDERASLPDDTPVGHGWITALEDSDLFKPNSNGHFTWWMDNVSEWGNSGNWEEWNLYDARPATVGDLRRVGLPIAEWPDITTPEPKPEVEPEEVTSESDEYVDPCPDWKDGEIRIGTFGDIAKRYGENVYFFVDNYGFSAYPHRLTPDLLGNKKFRAIDGEWSDDINKKAMEEMEENVIYELSEVPGSYGFIVKHEGEIYYAAHNGAWIIALEWQPLLPRYAVFCDAWRDMTSDPLGFGVYNWAKP